MKKFSIKLHLSHYIMVMLFLSAALFLVVLFTFNSFYRRAIQDAKAKCKVELINSSTKMDSFISRSTTAMDVTAKTIEFMLNNRISSEEIQKFFAEQSVTFRESMSESYTTMYGLFQGKYLDGNYWNPPEDYVPEERPWYLVAVKNKGKSTIVEPYVDADTKKMIISVSKLLSDGKSVIAQDVMMDEVRSFADELHRDHGFGFIIDNNGMVVAHQNRNEIGINYKKSRLPQHHDMHNLVNTIMSSPDRELSMKYNGDDCLIFTNRLATGWKAVAVVNKRSMFHSALRPLLQSSLMAIVAIVLIFVFLAICFLNLNHERNKAVEAEKAKSYFFATVSHDIRTPLNSIIGFSELLKRGQLDNEKVTEYINNIIFSGKTLMILINDVLDLAKLDAEKMQYSYEMCDFNTLVSNLMRTFEFEAEKSNVKLLKNIPENFPAVKIDQQRIRQILFNLVGNAVKFTNSGSITLHASFVESGDETGQLRFDIEDTGIGISEEDLPHLSKPFSQLNTSSKHKGTGLGLNICNSMISQMNGSLSIKSQLGKGSTFSVILNDVEYMEHFDEEVEKTISIPQSQLETISLLLVDDTQLNLKVMVAMCKRAGLKNFFLASSGAEALNILREQKVDAVLTDMWMPKMSGEELVKEIRQQPDLAELPVYVITADVDKLENWKDMGFTGIMLKPVTMASLSKLLNELQDTV